LASSIAYKTRPLAIEKAVIAFDPGNREGRHCPSTPGDREGRYCPSTPGDRDGRYCPSTPGDREGPSTPTGELWRETVLHSKILAKLRKQHIHVKE
jgi:hypothetical protein